MLRDILAFYLEQFTEIQ